MSTLLEVADVVRGDGDWHKGSGDQYDSVACAMSSTLTSICTPGGDREVLSGPDTDAAETANPGAFGAHLFAIEALLPNRLMCRSGDEEKWVRDAIESESDKAAGRVLQRMLVEPADHFVGWDADDDAIETVAGTETSNATLAAALEKFHDRVQIGDPILHVGHFHLLELAMQVADGKLKETNIRVATSAGYSSRFLAITGPVGIHLGSVQVIDVPRRDTNRTVTTANRLADIYFDPCSAVLINEETP